VDWYYDQGCYKSETCDIQLLGREFICRSQHGCYQPGVKLVAFFLKKNIDFIALRFINIYMKYFIKTVPDTSLHETSDLT